MKLTYGWLKDFIDLRIKPVEVANLLTCIGLEVSRAGIEYESNNMVVVGKVIEKRPIPESDRLSLCSVNVGGEKPLSIVCGARNVSAGQKVPVALEGAKLQNGLKIKKTKIRGEMSEGMICSEAELGISKEAEGIIVLDDQSSVGKVFTREMIAGDIVYDIDILPNRPDCMSVIGVARDISSKLDLDLNEPRIELKQEGKDVNTFVKVQIDAKRECPRYMAKY
ncbi:MAG: YtpR family tRNA-binding protein, partial [Elusimicrobiota bacterium]